MLREVNITGDAFTEQMPPAPLHWMLADQASCYVVEAVEEGVKIYPNPIGVLTNNPPFPFHLDYIRNFLHLSPETPENHFAKRLESAGFQGKWGLTPYGEGMGAIGLPGDVSPASRFVRACFLKWNSVCGEDAEAEISQFFISWTVSVWCGDPYRRRRENMRPLFIPVVSGPGKGYTIIRHMMIRRSAEWICFRKI